MNVMHVVLAVSRRSKKGQNEDPEHIEGCKSCRDQSHAPEDFSIRSKSPISPQDGVLAEEPGQRRDSGNGNRSYQERPVSPRHVLLQTAHLSNVLQPAHSMDDTSGSEKEKCFEECVGHQMEDTCRIRSDATCHEHVAELTDGGIREDLLDIGLHKAN